MLGKTENKRAPIACAPMLGAACVCWLFFCAPSTAPAAQNDLFIYRGDPIPKEIEALYVKGLNFLVLTQTREGSWQGGHGATPGVVGLAVLAMLAHGEDPNFGPYSKPIGRGLNFILRSARRDNGYIGTTMYHHGFATLALAEAYGSVNDPRLGPALRKAVDLIISAQARNTAHGWRYSPETNTADTTVSGAQMVALFAARNAGLAIPEKAIKAGLEFFRKRQGRDGGFGYTSASGSNKPRTAIGGLVFALAKQTDAQEFKSAFRYLRQSPHSRNTYFFYYLYYASQTFFHADTEAWEAWNKTNIKRLADSQNDNGSWTGSHGAPFSTSAALLSLAVNYRFLPIYER